MNKIQEQRQPSLIATDDGEVVREPRNAKAHNPGILENKCHSKQVKMITLQILEAERNLTGPSSISIELQELSRVIRGLHAEKNRDNRRTKRHENLQPRKRTKFEESFIGPQADRSELFSTRIVILQQLPQGRPLCRPPRLPQLQAGEVVRTSLLLKRSPQVLRKSKEWFLSSWKFVSKKLRTEIFCPHKTLSGPTKFNWTVECGNPYVSNLLS